MKRSLHHYHSQEKLEGFWDDKQEGRKKKKMYVGFSKLSLFSLSWIDLSLPVHKIIRSMNKSLVQIMSQRWQKLLKHWKVQRWKMTFISIFITYSQYYIYYDSRAADRTNPLDVLTSFTLFPSKHNHIHTHVHKSTHTSPLLPPSILLYSSPSSSTSSLLHAESLCSKTS